MLGKKLINSGPVSSGANTFASENFNTVLYTGNGGTQRIGGYINRGAVFSGSSASTGSYISFTNDVYGSSTTVFSVSLWVRCTNTAGEIPIIGNGGTVGGTTGYAVYINSGVLTLTFITSGSAIYEVGSSINDNDWHHIVLTYNNGAYVLYLDLSLIHI